MSQQEGARATEPAQTGGAGPPGGEDRPLFAPRQALVIVGCALGGLIVAIGVAVALRGGAPGTPAGYVNMHTTAVGSVIGDPLAVNQLSTTVPNLGAAVAADINADPTARGAVVAPGDPTFKAGQATVSCTTTSTTGLVGCTWAAGSGGGRDRTAGMLVRVTGGQISNVYVAAANVDSAGHVVLAPAL